MISKVDTASPTNNIYLNLQKQSPKSFKGRTIFTCNNENYLATCDIFYNSLSAKFPGMSKTIKDNVFEMKYPDNIDNIIIEIVQRRFKNIEDIIVSSDKPKEL